MTIFGPDISSYEAGLDLSQLADAAFVLAKVTEGTYYTDADFPGWRAQAQRIGKPLFWYHFLSGEGASAQAEHTASMLVGSSMPGMLDCEPEGAFSPTLAQIVAYVKAAHARGLNLRLVYLPHWFWQQMGSPDLSDLAGLGVHLVSSAYPGGTGSAAGLYPGDGAAGWQPYGGMTPLIYQFTNQASDGGQRVDFNAFRGTLAQLLAVLDGTTQPAPTPGGIDMGSYTMSAGWQRDYPDVAPALQAHIPAGTVVDETQAAAYAMVRSLVAAERAGVIEQKLDELLARPAATAVDVAGLEAAIGSIMAGQLAHLTGGVDTGVLAAALAPALVAHLGLQVVAK